MNSMIIDENYIQELYKRTDEGDVRADNSEWREVIKHYRHEKDSEKIDEVYMKLFKIMKYHRPVWEDMVASFIFGVVGVLTLNYDCAYNLASKFEKKRRLKREIGLRAKLEKDLI